MKKEVLLKYKSKNREMLISQIEELKVLPDSQKVKIDELEEQVQGLFDNVRQAMPKIKELVELIKQPRLLVFFRLGKVAQLLKDIVDILLDKDDNDVIEIQNLLGK